MSQTDSSPLEQPAQVVPAGHAEATASAQSLHAAVFNDPVDFLHELKNISWALSPEGVITANNLRGFADTTTDPTARAAAEIAATHFCELSQLSQKARQLDVFGSDEHDLGKPGILPGDLDADAKFYQNDTRGLLMNGEIYGAVCTVAGALTTGLLGAATVAELAVPPSAVVAGLAPAAVGGMTVMAADTSWKMPGLLKAQAAETQKVLGQWPEINGRPSGN